MKRTSTRGRPREQFTAAASSSYVSALNDGNIDQYPSHSSKQCWFKSSCRNDKHVRYLSCKRVQISRQSLHCKVCCGLGSSHEQLAYAVFDQNKKINRYAVEAYALKGDFEHDGTVVNLNRHAFDIVTAPPLRIIAEVQGEQHITKLNTKANSNDDSLASRACRDDALAAAAVAQGWSVLWLQLGEQRGRKRRWTALLSQAVKDAADGKAPRLYSG